MTPCVGQHREWLEAFRKRYWDFYKQLLVYRQDPAPEPAAQLREKFDELFSTVTGYEELDRRIAQTRADKTYLLMVLDHPEIPLHNNPAELDARTRVRKRVVSYGPRSQAGARTWDAMETLLSTARKLGVNFFQYIRDRVSGARQMPSPLNGQLFSDGNLPANQVTGFAKAVLDALPLPNLPGNSINYQSLPRNT